MNEAGLAERLKRGELPLRRRRASTISLEGAQVEGQDLWKWFLAAVLACLALEMIVLAWPAAAKEAGRMNSLLQTVGWLLGQENVEAIERIDPSLSASWAQGRGAAAWLFLGCCRDRRAAASGSTCGIRPAAAASRAASPWPWPADCCWACCC